MRGSAAEDGFTVAEITVTLAIMAVLVLGMTGAVASGLRYLLTAKQRAVAVQHANAVVERARAVAQRDWSQLGLVPADVVVADDPNLSTGACGDESNVTMFSGEPIISAGTPDNNPLYPHISSVTAGKTSITLKAYVTGVTPGGTCSASNPTYKRVTVLGTWANAQKGTSNQVRLATYVFDVNGSPVQLGAGCTSNCNRTACTFNCGGTGGVGGGGAGCTSNCSLTNCSDTCSLTTCLASCNIAGCTTNCSLTGCTQDCSITSGGGTGQGCASNCSIAGCNSTCTISGGGGGECASNCTIAGCASNCSSTGCSSNCTITGGGAQACPPDCGGDDDGCVGVCGSCPGNCEGVYAFAGDAVYTDGSLLALNGNALSDTTIWLPNASGDGRGAGTALSYSGAALSPYAQIGSPVSQTTTQHESTSLASEDGGVGSGVWPSPNCNSSGWADYVPGLMNANLLSTGSSCSSLQYSDGFPYTSSSAGLSNGATMSTSVAAAGVLPAFDVSMYGLSGSTTATTTVDVNGSGTDPHTVTSTSQVSIAPIGMLGFNVAGYNATTGAVKLTDGTYSATTYAGENAASPATSGTFQFSIYDPNETLTVCDSRSGGYCLVTVDPGAAGFSGRTISATVTLSVTALLVETARITITTTIDVPAPTKVQNTSGTDTTYAKVVFPLPRIAAELSVQSPIGTSIASLKDEADFGQLVSVASYHP